MSGEIGGLIEKHEKMSVEWPVPDFFSLPLEVNKKFASPVFFYTGLAWELLVYPNGEPGSEGYIGLYLRRKSSGPPRTVTFSMGLRKSNDEKEQRSPETSNTFFDPRYRPDPHTQFSSWGQSKFLLRSDLLARKDQLAPADTLTVTCTLSVEDGNTLDDSLTTRLWNLSLNLAAVMWTTEDADVTLELPDGKLKAHKMILKSRSPVFRSMFSHDMKENQTGEVKIEDADKRSFEIVLAYTYTGEPSGLSSENAVDVYKLSHKYDLPDLTKCCREFLRVGLSVDTICDVVTIAVLYKDKKLMDSAKDYFIRHKEEIRKTDQWKALKEENLETVCEMLEYTLDKM